MTKLGGILGAVAGVTLAYVTVIAFAVTGGTLGPGWGAGIIVFGIIGAIVGAAFGSMASEGT